MIRVLKLSLTAFIICVPYLATQAIAQIETLNFDKSETAEAAIPSKNKTVEPLPPKQKNSPDDLIHYGDLIDVDVLGSIEYDWRGNLTPEGVLAGLSFTEDQIYAVCESTESVAAKIAKDYGRFLKNPKVVVSILDRSSRLTSQLFGAVNQPYRFRIKRDVYLNELLILAGGITERASGEIQIIRRADSSCAARSAAKRNKPENQDGLEVFLNVSDTVIPNVLKIKIADLLKGKEEANPKVFYGDLINVLEAEPVYVTGAVGNPSKISLRTELSISRAIATAGGLTKGANPKEVTIFRRIKGGTEVLKANLVEIEQGTQNDLVLKPFDVVEVSGRGRGRSKYPPIIQSVDRNSASNELPLRVID